jgi:hypothetical protein
MMTRNVSRAWLAISRQARARQVILEGRIRPNATEEIVGKAFRFCGRFCGRSCGGRLLKRAKSPRCRVRFDDDEVCDDICLDSAHTLVRFDAAAYHAVLEVQYDGSWSRKAGAMIKWSVVWGVAFEDGNWAEDVRREV